MFLRFFIALLLSSLSFLSMCRGQEAVPNASSSSSEALPAPGDSPQTSGGSFLDRWLSMVSATQAEQPHWITPVVTVTPRLEQEFRYDLSRQVQPNGTTVLGNYGGSKGLELIPSSRIELLMNPPPYIARSFNGVPDGFGDVSFLMKYRILAANEEHGNYIITAFLGGSIPTGSYANGTRDSTISPTLAAGKGWGNFDLTSTLGAILPTGDTSLIGRQVVWNSVAQYRVLRKIWPEAEVTYTYFSTGPNDGRTQVFLTPGILFGRFPIHNRFSVTVGTGVQIAATHFHTYNHKYILTVRFPF